MCSEICNSSESNLPKRPDITRGELHCYFVFDVADTIDLAKLVKEQATVFNPAQINLHPAPSPAYVEFTPPPLSATLSDVRLEDLTVERKAKIFDYGTVSIRLALKFSGDWLQFESLSHKVRQSNAFKSCAEATLSELDRTIQTAYRSPQKPLVEDYFVIRILELDPAITTDDLLKSHGADLARLVLGETANLTAGEQTEALRQRFSYFENDLVVVQWDAAIVIDTAEGADAVESILEFANTQLVELRTYDARLDKRLDEIYSWEIAKPKKGFLDRLVTEHRLFQLRSLMVDVRELNDRSNNALKIMGDAYYARIYRSTVQRLGLQDWQQQIESKLSSVGEVYRFATDQFQHSRSEFLELVIIVLIILEIALGAFSLHH